MQFKEFVPTLQGVLFDLDGTLIDTEHLHYESTNRILQALGHRLDYETFAPYIGWAEEPFWQALRRRFGIHLDGQQLARQRSKAFLEVLRDHSIEPLPGAAALLEALQSASIPCAVASSSLREQIEAMLTAAGLREHIRAIRSGHDDVVHGKPAPDVYQAAAAALTLDPNRCLAIEDSATGVTAAKAAGCFTIAIPCASHPDPDLGHADAQRDSLTELLQDLQARVGD